MKIKRILFSILAVFMFVLVAACGKKKHLLKMLMHKKREQQLKLRKLSYWCCDNICFSIRR